MLCLLLMGKIIYVDANGISIKRDDIQDSLILYEGEDVVHMSLKKFSRTNQNTVHNQRPLVTEGQSIKKGEPIADGASTQNGELALGNNIRVAFMPWRGLTLKMLLQ